MDAYEERLDRRKAQNLQWIANPLHYFRRHLEEQEHGIAQALQPSGLLFRERRLEEAEEAREAAPIELFYDLFFVANLTTVTSIQHINTRKTLASYAFTFAILWFTWLQVTLYDVRFSVDSVYERVCKAVHFGVMVGFASVSTSWNPFDPDADTVDALKQLTIILLISRAMLGIQYLIVMLYAWRYEKTKVPLTIHTMVMFLSAIIYLGLFFGFHPNPDNRTYVGWYVAIAFEAITVITTSCIWRVVSFKRTHLVERMGLLTLIVLGEGIIVMLKAVNTIVKSASWTIHVIGIIVAAIAIIYFLYMFYFDYNPRNTHYGSIRQQLWALLHFPFHLSLVLVMEGMRQLTIWWSFYSGVTHYYMFLTNVDTKEAIPTLREYFEKLYDKGSSTTVIKEYNQLLTDLDNLDDGNYTAGTRQDMVNQITNGLFTGLSEFYGIETEETENAEGGGAGEELATTDAIKFFSGPLESAGSLFVLVYHYFFVCLGLLFTGFALFTILVRRKKDVYDWCAVALRGVTAIVFFGLSSQYHHGIGDKETLLLSPWPVPVVCLVLFTVLVLDKLLNWVAYHNTKAKTTHEEERMVQTQIEPEPELESPMSSPVRRHERRRGSRK